MELSFHSQDILDTQTIPFFRKDESPTKAALLREWNCIEASTYGFRSWDDMSSGSNQLPSLGTADKLPDIIVFPHLSIPISEIQTIEGLDDLACIAIQYLHQLKEMFNNPPIKEFLHVLTVFEHLGLSRELGEDVLCHLDLCLKRLLGKVASISLSEVTLKKCAVKNPSLHACIFSWKVAYSIYTANTSLSAETCSRRCKLLDDLMVATVCKLVKIFENYRTIAPCSCMQSFIFILSGDKEKKFEEIFMRCFENIRQNDLIQFTDSVFVKVADAPNTMSLFSYYVALTEYLIEVQRLKKDGDWTGAFLFRIFGMAEKLVSVDLLNVCEVLVSFLDKNEPGSLMRSKMFSKKFWTEIVRYLESRPIKELESTAIELPNHWSSVILSMGSSTNREIYLLRLLGKLMADKNVWENTRILIKNHFSAKKISFNPNTSASMLSLLMCLCVNENVGRELVELDNLPKWLADAVEGGNSKVQTIVLNANRAFAEIYEKKGLWYPKDEILYTLINKIPLPSATNLFLDTITSLVPYRKITGIDFNRAEFISESEFCRLLSHFVDADWTLPQKIWLRANGLVEARKGGSVTKQFVVNQFRAGLQENLPFFTTRLSSLIDKYSKDPWRVEALTFCSKLLESGRSYSLNLDQFVPLWISSVVGFSKTHELQVRDLTKSIWEGLCQIIRKNGGNEELDPSREFLDPVACVIKTIQVLQTLPNKQWALQKIGLWFPPSLAQSLQMLIKRKDSDEATEDRRNNAVEIIASLLEYCAPFLYTLSEINESKHPFNGSTLVVTVCSVTDREVLQRKYRIINVHICGIVSGLVKIPETVKRAIFVRSRLKDILLSYYHETIGQQIAKIILHQKNYVEQLKKDNAEIRSLFENVV